MRSTYKTNQSIVTQAKIFFFIPIAFLYFSACKKLIEVPAPVTSINTANVYTSDATAAAVLTDIYANLSAQNSNIAGEGIGSLSLFASLSSDELTLYNLNDAALSSYYTNDLTDLTRPSFWESIYPVIFVTNAAIEGLTNTNVLTSSIKQQLLGEAKFTRAFCYFYLANLYGDIPLPLTTNYEANSHLLKTTKTEVYERIIADLRESQTLLSNNYLAADALTVTEERVRPTKWAATALLARAYLYTENFADAETEASKIINHTALYNLSPLNDAFLKNSMEAIWQLQPVGIFEDSNTGEGKIFVLPDSGPDNGNYPIYLSDDLANSFEVGDQRKVNWINQVTVNGNVYYYPYKYKIGRVDAPTSEYSMILRLGEQYLIRAEARVRTGNIAGAISDLNAIRNRAALANTVASTTSALTTAIQQERKAELFTEWGHRWLDLKRSNTADEVMNIVTSKKGGTWNTMAQLYPIPLTELQKAPHLTQNPGY